MSRIYQLDTISQEDIDASLLTVVEDNEGIQTSAMTMSQLLEYLFNGAATDASYPFEAFEIAIGNNAVVMNPYGIAIGNNTTSGYSSVSLGIECTASSYGCISAGYNNSSSGYYGVAIGSNNSVSGYNLADYLDSENYIGKCVGFGYSNNIIGVMSTALGVNNTVHTEGPVVECSAVGFQNTASGFWSASAFGYKNNALSAMTSAFGHKNTASYYGASAFGNFNTSTGAYSTACGYYNTVNSNNSSAFGSSCSASASYATAIGYKAMARVEATTNIAGPIIVRGDNDDGFNPSEQFAQYSGVQNVLMTCDIDLTVATFSINSVSPSGSTGGGYSEGDTLGVDGGNGDAVITVASVDESGVPLSYTITTPGTGYASGSSVSTAAISSTGNGEALVNINVVQPTEIDLPYNCLFYVDEVGITLDNYIGEVTTLPIVSFGWAGDSPEPSGILAPTQTTNLISLNSREIFSTLLTYDGQQTLTFTVNTAGNASFLHGRGYFVGMLVESSPPGS